MPEEKKLIDLTPKERRDLTLEIRINDNAIHAENNKTLKDIETRLSGIASSLLDVANAIEQLGITSVITPMAEVNAPEEDNHGQEEIRVPTRTSQETTKEKDETKKVHTSSPKRRKVQVKDEK